MSKYFKKDKFSFLRAAHAANQTTVVTQGGADNGGSLFTDLTRVVWSKEISFRAMPLLRFFQFAKVQTELMVEAGKTISMLTYDNLKRGGKLVELKPMETQALNGSTKQVEVSEYGNSTAITEMTVQSSWDNVINSAVNLLSRDYATVLDCELRDAALSGTNRVYAAKKADRVSLLPADIMSVATVKDAVEVLSTNNAPKAAGGNYWICFVHPYCGGLVA